MDLQGLTLQEKLGQMMMVGLKGKKIDNRITTLIRDYKVGGVILYKKNFSTYDEMVNLIHELKKLNSQNKIPLFISIDQEGGRVNRMPKEFKNLPAAYKIAQTQNDELTKEASQIIGEMLFKTGVNMNFAPVLDIKRFKDNHAIGDRCYGNTKEDVIKLGIPAMKEMQKQGIVPVVKHFPGHGLTKKDSHFFLPVVNEIWTDIENADIQPFEEAIKNGTDAVMVGHLIIRSATGTYPASLSRKFIGRILRKKLRFNGVVITDDLRMRAIRFVYGYKIAIKKAFLSGSDIVVFRFGEKDEKKAIADIMQMIKSKQLKEGRINRSVRRILKVKEKYNLSDTNELPKIDINNINERIDKIKKEVKQCQDQ